MGPLGLPELIVIGAILLLFFGARRLPAIARWIASLPTAFMRGKNENNKSDDHEHLCS
jgi:Sec-independent protein translocase protein TatA